MKKDVEGKREREKQVVSQMIALYCRKQHKEADGLCGDCRSSCD